jgi:hypothetical protein
MGKRRMNMIKYQGIVIDRFNGESVKTKYYKTYDEALIAAEKLSKKYYLEWRGNITVVSKINTKDRFYKSIAKMI